MGVFYGFPAKRESVRNAHYLVVAVLAVQSAKEEHVVKANNSRRFRVHDETIEHRIGDRAAELLARRDEPDFDLATDERKDVLKNLLIASRFHFHPSF